MFRREIVAHSRKNGLDSLSVDHSGFTGPLREQVITHVRAMHTAHLNKTVRPFIKFYVDGTRGVL